MILLLDTTRYGELRVGIYHRRLRVVRQTVDGPVRGQLLQVIDDALRASRSRVLDCVGVIVARGPGPYSALRSAAAVANAIGFALGIPVVGVLGARSMRELAARGMRTLRRAKAGAPVVPHYGSPPNITVPRATKLSFRVKATRA